MATAKKGQPSPMPPLGTQEIFTLAVLGKFSDTQTVNIFHYQGNMAIGAATEADLEALSTLWLGVGGVLTPFLGAVSVDWSFIGVSIFAPTQPSLATLVTELVGEIGQGPAGALPNQACVTLQKRTAWRGKHGRGRSSIPAVPRTWVTASYLQLADAYTNLAGAMQADLSDGAHTFIPGLLAQTVDPTTLIKFQGWRPLTAVKVNQTLGTCRRRKPGVGK